LARSGSPAAGACPSTSWCGILGDCGVDLREAELPDGPLHIEARAVLGDILILVPEGTTVR
jgi:hypothetical protein